jgi:hypothetical protein
MIGRIFAFAAKRSPETTKPSQARSKVVTYTGALVILVGLIAVVEIASMGSFFLMKNQPAFRLRVFYPAELSDAEIDKHKSERHALLGWPSKNVAGLDHDSHSERLSPANRTIQDPTYCMEVYGDSFTYSSDVGNDDAWPNRLAMKTNCKVLNFGIGGYGVDQAVLRHQANARHADYAALVIFPDDIKRNLNQHRSLISAYTTRPDFKPRFVIADDGTLDLLLPFFGSPKEIRQALRDPNRILDAERFLPESESVWAKVVPAFPYTWSTIKFARRLFGEFDIARVLHGNSRRGLSGMNASPYELRTESLRREARMILELLTERFRENCQQKAQTCYVVLLPDLDYLERVDQAEEAIDYYFQNIKKTDSFHDLTAFLREKMKGEYCQYISRGNCWGHFNAKGYDIISDFFVREFSDAFRRSKTRQLSQHGRARDDKGCEACYHNNFAGDRHAG